MPLRVFLLTFVGNCLFCSEVAFTLRFCKSQVSYAIDQGVRLEVGIKTGSDATTKWYPVRYYTPSISSSSYQSLVYLNSSNETVTADALTYSSILPLKFVNASKNIAIKEYLCGNFTRGSGNVRLRWMQRFGTQVGQEEDFSPWAIGNIHIKFWNGSCFIDYIGTNDTKSVRGNFTSQSCNTAQGNSARYFFSGGGQASTTRRSIIVTSSLDITSNHKCEEGSFSGGKLVSG